MIRNGSTVSIHFTLSADEQLVETSAGQQPLTYTHGAGQIVPGLEAELEGMEKGEHRQITLPADKAFGEYDPEAVRRFPRGVFQDAEGLDVGDRVTAQAEGRRVEATVSDVDDEAITLDFNHPLAGKTLYFDVEVVEVE